MTEENYNLRLKNQLLGRTLLPEAMPKIHRSRPMFSFWGGDAGIPEGDVHHSRAYRIYISYNEALTITDAEVVVEGELISPCAGYTRELLHEFDYGPVLRWCMAHTAEP